MSCLRQQLYLFSFPQDQAPNRLDKPSIRGDVKPRPFHGCRPNPLGDDPSISGNVKPCPFHGSILLLITIDQRQRLFPAQSIGDKPPPRSTFPPYYKIFFNSVEIIRRPGRKIPSYGLPTIVQPNLKRRLMGAEKVVQHYDPTRFGGQVQIPTTKLPHQPPPPSYMVHLTANNWASPVHGPNQGPHPTNWLRSTPTLLSGNIPQLC